jgi:hypothetical protein
LILFLKPDKRSCFFNRHDLIRLLGTWYPKKLSKTTMFLFDDDIILFEEYVFELLKVEDVLIKEFDFFNIYL